MTSNENTDLRNPSYAWVMVFASFVLSALAFGSLASISVFMKPLSEEFGWSRGEISLAYTVASFASAAFGVYWGYIADKHGTRLFGFVAAIFMSVTLYLLSDQSSLFQFYLLYFLFGAFGCAMVMSPLFANVGFWFRSNPGLALGIAASGGAIGQAIVPYVCGILIESSGWQEAYVFLAIVYIVIAFPVAFLVKESPWRERARVSTEEELREFPLSEKEVVSWISFAVIFCCVCMSVPIVHLVPLLTDAGFTLEFATKVLMVLMICGAFGRVLGGKLGDVIGALPAYIIMSLGQTVSVVWFPHIYSEVGLYALAAFFGFTYSGVMSSILVCTRMMVSAKYAARAMSLTSFFGWIGMGFGGFLGGYFYDLEGDYVWSFAFAGLMGVINLLVLLKFWSRIKKQSRLISAS
jgi:MFS family permease